MRKWIVVLAGAALLILGHATILSRERLIEEGRTVLLELAPVDPRSLMQGDSMRVQCGGAREALPTVAERAGDGPLVFALHPRGVASFRRIDNGTPLAADEIRLRYRVRQHEVRFATNAWFFEEGHDRDYALARFGEF